MTEQNKLLLNILSGPAGGKSTLAAELYMAFKKKHYAIEYVNEFAKELIYADHQSALPNQVYVFAHQLYKIECAYKHNQIVVTDSPILLSAIYHPEYSEILPALVVEQYQKFNNFNILLTRSVEREHCMVGRVHSLSESISIDNEIKSWLDEIEIEYMEYDAIHTPISELVELVEDCLAIDNEIDDPDPQDD